MSINLITIDKSEYEKLMDIRKDAKFLCDRLVAYEADGCQCDQSVREWCGHVTPALARMQSYFIND